MEQTIIDKAWELYPCDIKGTKGMIDSTSRKHFLEGAEYVYNNITPLMAKNLLFAIDSVDNEIFFEDNLGLHNDEYWERVCTKYNEIINK